MSSYHKVAVLGKGFLGSVILEELVNSGFETTIITRNRISIRGTPPGVAVIEVDYSSLGSLADALKEQDAVISTVNASAIFNQMVVIDACIQAGVKRYIPCNWSSMSADPKTVELAAYGPMIQTQEYLEQKARAGEITFTSFCNGAFFDMIFTVPFVINWENHSVRLYDKGVHPFSTTRLATVGKAVAGALNTPEVTKNKVLFIHDIIITQAKLLSLVKKHSPPGLQWTEVAVDAEAELRNASKSIQERGVDWENTVAQLTAGLFGGKYDAAYQSVDNELLGLGYFAEDELEAKVIEKLRTREE